MKLHNLILSTCVLSLSASMMSCSDDMFETDGKEAFILGTNDLDCLKVTGRSGVIWKSRMSNDTIYIKLSPTVNPAEEIDSVAPKFFVSKGATVTPDPSEPQNFAVEGGVKYTVTSEDGNATRTYVVTHGLTDLLEYGGGFTRGIVNGPVKFPDLGYPGEQANYNLADSRQYGDLNGYVAFCGYNHFVLMAGQYSNPKFDNPAMNIPDESLAFKVFNFSDFTPAGNLNLGSIPMANVRCLSSDINGTLVAGVNNGSNADIYYWESYNTQPKLLAHFDENLFMNGDGSNYLQIQGDIFGVCNITTNALRDPKGNHYMIHLENGQVTDKSIVSTGCSSGDAGGFQMITPLTSELHCSYVMGDNEGSGNNTLRVYANTFAGKTKVIMPNVLQNDWQQWWVGTGSTLARPGARRPYVSAMNINGKIYVSLMLGTGWWWHNDVVEVDDLHTRVIGTTVAYSTNCAWSFGGSSDWCWNPSKTEGFIIGYTDRYGVYSVRMTCYE